MPWMADFDIEAMRANRDAGTPGTWDAALERGCHGVIAHTLPQGGANFVALIGNDAIKSEREPERFANARRIASVPAMEAEIERLTASLAQAVGALEECKDDLDRYSQMEYPSDHPIHVRKRKNDFDGNPARIAIASIKGQDIG